MNQTNIPASLNTDNQLFNNSLINWTTQDPNYADNQLINTRRAGLGYYTPPQQASINTQELLQQYILRYNKSKFEEILDSLFSSEEKKEYLLSIGYSIDSYGKLYREDSKAPNRELNSLFLFEVTIKFKNLLLSKGTLKLKL